MIPTPKLTDVKVLYSHELAVMPGIIITEMYTLYDNVMLRPPGMISVMVPMSCVEFETVLQAGESVYHVEYSILGHMIKAPVIIHRKESIEEACYRHYTEARETSRIPRFGHPYN